MVQYKLSLLPVMLIGAFACSADRSLVGIENSHIENPNAGSGAGAGSVGSSGGPGAIGSGGMGGGEITAPQGIFVPTGSMTVPRQYHTATLLPTGKVLIAGGRTDPTGSALASAELFDPSTGIFTATGSMTAARDEHTATLLPTGKVLVAGGGILGAQTSAELYDPSAGRFTATGAMTVSRWGHTATLLDNGKVLVAGGGYLKALAELYDPSAGRFTATGVMTVSRYFSTATLLGDGKVLIAGGWSVSDKQGMTLWERHVASAELYDPGAGTFEATGTMTVPRYVHTATSLLDGKVLVAGDQAVDGCLSAELYDPTAGAFVATGNGTVQGRGSHTATLLPGGMVLVAGGNNDTGPGGDLASTALYDPDAGTFAATGNMSVARSGHTATLLPNGMVLIAGGDTFGTAELYE
jgi:hypothetical protein